MDLNQRVESVGGDGREFLKTTVGLEYKTAGVTLDRAATLAAFPDGTVPGGTAIRRGAGDLFVPVAAADVAPFDGPCLTAHAVAVSADGANPIVGAITAGYVDRTRATGVTDAFVTAVAGRLIFDL